MTQMEPGEITVRKDGRDMFFGPEAGPIEVTPTRSRSSPIWQSKPTTLTKPRLKKPGNAPRLA